MTPYQAFKRTLVRGVIRLGLIQPFIWLFARVIQEVPGRGDVTDEDERPTLLALNPDRFRGDLRVLARTGEVRVLALPFSWQKKFLPVFWPEHLLEDLEKSSYWHPTEPSIRRGQDRLRAFYRKLLPALYQRLGVDAVIGAGVHYVQDYDWGIVSSELGTPYIVLHRENLQAAGDAYRRALGERYENMTPYGADHVIVHNEETRQTLVEGNMLPPERVHALGCLRMDEFVRRFKDNHRSYPAPSEHVVLFSFPPQAGVPGVRLFSGPDESPGFYELFDEVHLAVGELARDHPDVKFTIKAKWGGRWLVALENLLIRHGLLPETLDNLTITASGDAHDLMLGASVVIGFGSTAVIEAGATGVPVIVPMFAEAAQESHREYLYFREEVSIFDTAKNPEHLKRLVLERLRNPTVDDVRLDRRRHLFERWVSGTDAKATQRYLDVILGSIDRASRRGQQWLARIADSYPGSPSRPAYPQP